jgi:hypothetical protein
MLNSKAQGFPIKLVSLIGSVFLLLFGIFVVCLPLIGNYYVSTEFSTNVLTQDIWSTRVVSAPECMAFEDDLGRVHPGLIDLSKINQVNNCIGRTTYLSLSDLYGNNEDLNSIDSPSDDTYTSRFLIRYITDSSDTNIKTGILEVGFN